MSLEFVHSRKGTKRYRRPAASKYLKEQWGIDLAPRTLAKLACVGGGPPIEYVGRFPTYTEPSLDTYAEAKISAPVASTSERGLQLNAA